MNKEEFLQTLGSLLQELPADDRDMALAFYEESISDRMEDGQSEEEAVRHLGDAAELASSILGEFPEAEGDNGDDKAEEKLYETDVSELKRVSLHVHNLPVQLCPSEDNRLRFHYYENDKVRFQIGERYGVLYIEQNQPREFWRLRPWKDRTVILAVPKAFLGDTELRNANGKVMVEGLCLAGKLMCHATNAAVVLQDIEAAAADVSSANGRAELSGLKLPGALDCHVTNSKINISAVSAGQIDVATKNGKITLSDVASAGNLKANNLNGKIEVERISGTDIRLKTVNGKIEGSVRGRAEEYSVSAKTVNGTCSVPRGENEKASKSLTAKTVNGGITLSFTGTDA